MNGEGRGGSGGVGGRRVEKSVRTEWDSNSMEVYVDLGVGVKWKSGEIG